MVVEHSILGNVCSFNKCIYYLPQSKWGRGDRKKDLLSQYQFREAIAHYWINPKLVESELHLNEPAPAAFAISRKRKQAPSPSTSVSTMTTASIFSNPSSKAQYCTDAVLKWDGKLCCRLDPTHDHLPRHSTKRATCALHRWVGSETRSEVSLCVTCQLNLCIGCYAIFHKIPDLHSMKESVERIYNKQKDK